MSLLHFLDYRALPSKLSQIRLLIPGNTSQRDILLTVIHILCMRACHKHPSEEDAKMRETPGHVQMHVLGRKLNLLTLERQRLSYPPSLPSDPANQDTLH